jgi:protein phosphatase 2C family protein 2/3
MVVTAEFRGPGIRNQFEETPDNYDLENDRSRGFSVRSGRIILLGDGTELIPEQNDEELFDQREENRDVANHLQHESPDSSARGDREGTPGPQSKNETASKAEGSSTAANLSESPSSTNKDSSGSRTEATEKSASS